jgi:hypothetical protein
MTQITESRALEIGRQLVLDEHDIGEDELNDLEIRLEQGGMGHTLFDLNETYWLVTFNFGKGDTFLSPFEPDYLVVFVDAVTGDSVWIPETHH